MKGEVKQLAGRTFGRLTAIKINDYRRFVPYWKCECKCGKVAVVNGYSLLKGVSKSCGCFMRERSSTINLAHGETRGRKISREFSAWCDMRRRCGNPKRKDWKFYGGRGIKVCERWQSLENFISDMGRCPEGCSLDRIDNSKGYTPDNCRWASRIVQMNNTRGNRLIEFGGLKMSVADWARKTGLKAQVIDGRLNKHGWEVSRALTQPYRYDRKTKTTSL